MKSVTRSLGLVLSLSALLTACGGGGSQIEPFKPQRMIVLGDEHSALLPDGRKYTVNGLSADTDTPPAARKCDLNPIWVQSVASAFGIVFKECNPTNASTTAGIMYAAKGARVAEVTQQIDTHLKTSDFRKTDLVTLMVGANDVLELYAQYPAKSVDTLLAEAGDRGARAAEQVNRVARAGGRVLITTIPDMGFSPFGVNEKANKTDIDRAKLLNDLSIKFNAKLRLNLIDDGHLIALVLADERLYRNFTVPAYTAGMNISQAACLSTVDVLDCTSKTLVSGATTATWLWATDTAWGPTMHSVVGAEAATKAVNQPF
ncbi:SGNH/GDSL hydrolase family protein [Roseateles sp. BYS180W]|uniref:SGNH/GDSL hydrolase family protein n=1 Tax=Roseateles rivi TaxID=3299028 RepID=A0ABW7FWM4_9BURK